MENLEILKGFVKNAIDGIIMIDERGIISTINPSACQLFGYSPEEVIGQNVSLLMPTPDRERHDSYLQRYHDTHVPRIIGIGREVKGLKRDGSRFPLKLGVSEVLYRDVKIYIGFIHDLTQQKKDEEQLKGYASHLEELVEKRTQSLNETISQLEQAKTFITESLDREKELGQMKSRFVSMASHEFRTPLQALQLSASLIGKYAEPFQSPEIEKHLRKIKNAVGHLTAILNDFLQIEKLESGKVEVHYSWFSLPLLAAEIAEEMRLLAKPGQRILHRHIGEAQQVQLDQNLLKNSILNLVSNAIKYAPEDTLIEIATTANEEGCRISVRDSGMGIPKQEQEHLFEPFFRAANAALIAGTGLGLTIVSRYVKLMNGRVNFESEAEKGTTFTLTFPMHDHHFSN